MKDNLIVLRKPDGGEVHLLGTCHSSAASASAAAELVTRVRPLVVVLELDESRRHILQEDDGDGDGDESSSSGSNMRGVASEVGSVMSDWTSFIQLQYSALDSLGVPRAGGEFRAAAKAGEACGAHVVLGDRSVATTQIRLRRLTPLYEMITALFYDDPQWVEDQAVDRHETAKQLERTSAELAEALEMPRGAAREARLHALSDTLARQSTRAVDLSFPPLLDGVFYNLMSRFWRKQVIGAPEKEKLRTAIEGLHRVDPLTSSSLSPTWRRVLIEERDVVLADVLKRQPGERVVGIVGKGHLAGIAKAWEEETASRVPEMLAQPPANLFLQPVVIGTAAAVGAAYGMVRSRVVRVACGGVAVGAVAFTAMAADRLSFYKRTQRELQLQERRQQQ